MPKAKPKLACLGLLSEATHLHRAENAIRLQLKVSGGDACRELRAFLELTQLEMAKRLAVTPYHICRLEAGTSVLSLDLAARMCVLAMEKR